MIKSSLFRRIPLPDWILDGAHFREYGLSLEFDRIFVQIVDLHHEAESLRHEQNEPIRYAMDLDIEAQSLTMHCNTGQQVSWSVRKSKYKAARGKYEG